jgi:hypothetical protein
MLAALDAFTHNQADTFGLLSSGQQEARLAIGNSSGVF